jgi:nucleolar GTP-binding protein
MARPSRPTKIPVRGRPAEGKPVPSQEILELAFHRASLVNPHGTTKPERDRRRARLKVVRASATVSRHLRLAVRELRPPALGELEEALVDRAFGPGALARHLLRLRRAEERIRLQARDAERAVDRAAGSEELGEIVRRFYGRLASFVREVDPDLARIAAIRRFLRERPHLDPSVPRLVVAGFPNVGKSSLVARLSSARPKVAEYPFTTVAIAVGHADLGFDRLQVVDTPGVLGRRGQSNPAEAEAETTVQRAASVVLFVLDPSGTSGYPIEEQERLLERWRVEFPGLPIVAVETKCDLLRRPSAGLHVSSTTGEGLDRLWEALRARFAPRGELPPLEEAIEEAPPEEYAPPVPRRRRASASSRTAPAVGRT